MNTALNIDGINHVDNGMGKILIVDDDVDFAESLSDILILENYDVSITHSITETFSSISEIMPDIALIDLKLGADNGIDLLRQLKQKWDSNLVCVVITAYADFETAMDAIREGADNYLQKPIRKDVILSELKRSIDKVILKKEKDGIHAELMKSQNLLDEAQNIAKLGSWEHDLLTGELIWSSGLYKLLELDPDEHIPSLESYFDFIHPDDRDYFKNVHENSKKYNQGFDVEHRLCLPGTGTKYINHQCKVYCDNSGKVPRSYGTVLDITERKLEELTLQDVAKGFSVTSGEEFFQALTKHIGDTLNIDFAIVGSKDRDNADRIRTVAVYNNGKYIDNFHYSMKGTPCEIVLNKTSKGYSANVRNLFPQFELLKQLDIESYVGSPLYDSSGKPLGIIVILNREEIKNIKKIESLIQIYANRAAAELERLRYEESIRSNEEKFRSLVEYAPDGIVMIGPGGTIDTVNIKLETMSGYERKELIGRNISMLVPKRYKTHNKLMKGYYNKPRVQDMAQGMEVYLKCKNGREIPVEINLNPLDTEEGLYVSAEIHDISGRIKAEKTKRSLEEELFRAQKMEAIGQLTGGIAHDFNNILTSILGYTRLALRQGQVEDNNKLREYLAQIKHGGERASELVRQMLSYSRNMPDDVIHQELTPVIDNVLKLLRPTLPKTVDIKFNRPEDRYSANIDAVQFEQVIINLCINSRDAMKETGRIDISINQVTVDSIICDSCHKEFSGNYIGISISDTGEGIEEESIQRIFDPFYTTRGVTKGSGLGLSMVHGSIHSVGGHILVDSMIGEGTKINLILPLIEQANLQPEDRSSGHGPADSR